VSSFLDAMHTYGDHRLLAIHRRALSDSEKIREIPGGDSSNESFFSDDVSESSSSDTGPDSDKGGSGAAKDNLEVALQIDKKTVVADKGPAPRLKRGGSLHAELNRLNGSKLSLQTHFDDPSLETACQEAFQLFDLNLTKTLSPKKISIMLKLFGISKKSIKHAISIFLGFGPDNCQEVTWSMFSRALLSAEHAERKHALRLHLEKEELEYLHYLLPVCKGLRTGVLDRVWRMFTAVDVNGDGTISKSEFVSMLAAIGYCREDQVERLWQTLVQAGKINSVDGVDGINLITFTRWLAYNQHRNGCRKVLNLKYVSSTASTLEVREVSYTLADNHNAMHELSAVERMGAKCYQMLVLRKFFDKSHFN
jgi:Ca2+-binding EF-hand superfamily protein